MAASDKPSTSNNRPEQPLPDAAPASCPFHDEFNEELAKKDEQRVSELTDASRKRQLMPAEQEEFREKNSFPGEKHYQDLVRIEQTGKLTKPQEAELQAKREFPNYLPGQCYSALDYLGLLVDPGEIQILRNLRAPKNKSDSPPSPSPAPLPENATLADNGTDQGSFSSSYRTAERGKLAFYDAQANERFPDQKELQDLWKEAQIQALAPDKAARLAGLISDYYFPDSTEGQLLEHKFYLDRANMTEGELTELKTMERSALKAILDAFADEDPPDEPTNAGNTGHASAVENVPRVAPTPAPNTDMNTDNTSIGQSLTAGQDATNPSASPTSTDGGSTNN